MPHNNDRPLPPGTIAQTAAGTALENEARASSPNMESGMNSGMDNAGLTDPDMGDAGGELAPATIQKKRRAFLKRFAGRLRRRGIQIPDLDMSKPIRILLVTDAWVPQVNGVVRSLETLSRELTKLGHEVRVVEPSQFRTFPMPTYPEIRLAVYPNTRIKEIIREFQPNAIHIATEGPLGWAARNICVRKKLAFTTSFHTRFPEYVHARTRFPKSWSYNVIKRFHKPASTMMVATQSLYDEMTARGFKRLQLWARGVDLDLFYPRDKQLLDHLPRPIWLYVGRVAVEKNLDSFLGMNVPGTKLVVGDGPQLKDLTRRYPDAVFAGAKFGDELAHYYAASDVFVFPSKTDTFGLVLVEALASGIPVAAYPVQGPLDVIGDAHIGVLHEDLSTAAKTVWDKRLTAEQCRAYAMGFSWETCARQFVANLAVDEEPPAEDNETPVPSSDLTSDEFATGAGEIGLTKGS